MTRYILTTTSASIASDPAAATLSPLSLDAPPKVCVRLYEREAKKCAEMFCRGCRMRHMSMSLSLAT